MTEQVPASIASVQVSPYVIAWAEGLASAQERVPLEAGQVWRARSGACVTLVVLLGGTGRIWQMAPATLEPVRGDDLSLTVPAGMSGIGCPMTVWAGLQRELPVVVLDRLIGQAPEQVTLWCVHAVSSVPSNPPAGCDRGEPLTVFSSGNDLAVELAAELEILSSAATLVDGDGTAVDQSALLNGVSLAAVMAALGVSQGVAMDIVGGDRSVDPAQADALAALSGHAASEFLSARVASPDEAFQLEAPWNRALIELVASREQRTPFETREALVQSGLALAARVTGQRDGETEARVRAVLEARAADASQ